MAVTISRAVHDALIAAAAAAPWTEVCGLLFGDPDRIDDFALTENVAADRARRFEIDPFALIAAHRAARAGGPRPVGNFHSHPNGCCTPSATDAALSAADGSLWAIVAGGRVALWRARPGGFDRVAMRIVD